MGFVDTWELKGRPAPIKTCRFDTRIDYIFASPGFVNRFKPVSIQHVDDRASDHNMVIAEFDVKECSALN